MQGNLAVHTMGYRVEDGPKIYKYNGLTNYADGSASPFTTNSGKVLIKFKFNAGSISNYPTLLSSASSDWVLYVSSKSKHLILLYKSGEEEKYIAMQNQTIEEEQDFEGSIFIDTQAKKIHSVINGTVNDVSFASVPNVPVTFEFAGARNGKHSWFSGELDISLFDIGHPENDRNFTLDKKLGVLVDHEKTSKNLFTNQGLIVANEATVNTIIESKKWTIKTTDKKSYNKAFGGHFYNFPCQQGKTYLFSVTADNPVNLVVYDGAYKLVSLAEDSDSIVFTAKEKTLLYICPRTDEQTTVLDPVVKELVAWPIKQFSDEDVKAY